MILIPAYQAAPTLGPLLRRIRRASNLPVLVVDDGSPDATAEIAETEGAELLRHPRNLGKGAALKTGFAYALNQGAPGVLTLDADGQHPPELIPDFLQASQDADIVLGCRMDDPGDMPWLRLQVNRLTSRAVSGLARRPLKDSQCGYRWISAEVLRAVRLRTGNYQTESELLIRAARLGFRVKEIPVPALYAGEASHIRRGLDTLRFLGLVASFAV